MAARSGWCEPNQSWCLEEENPAQGKAVATAIKRALAIVDVDPFKVGFDRFGEAVGLVSANLAQEMALRLMVAAGNAPSPSRTQVAWTGRILELQAVLDLYLIALKRLNINTHDPCPRLSLVGWQSQSRAEQVLVSRVEVWDHLSRRSSLLEDFTFPVRSANDGVGLAALDAVGRERLIDYLLKIFSRQRIARLIVAAHQVAPRLRRQGSTSIATASPSATFVIVPCHVNVIKTRGVFKRSVDLFPLHKLKAAKFVGHSAGS